MRAIYFYIDRCRKQFHPSTFTKGEIFSFIFHLFLGYCIWRPHMPASGREELPVHILHASWHLSHTHLAIPSLGCRSQPPTTPYSEAVQHTDNYFHFLYFLHHCHAFWITAQFWWSAGQISQKLEMWPLENYLTSFSWLATGKEAYLYKPWSLTVNILLLRIFLGS